ncbi:hypothetical protein ACJ41O_012915 [Fusarium nematophilum]
MMANSVHRRSSYDGGLESGRAFDPSPDPGPAIPQYRRNTHLFAGRLGANQAFTLDRRASDNEKLLEQEPDATPHMSFQELMDLRPITNSYLWKAAVIEGIGSLMLVYITSWVSISPAEIPVKPTAQLGNFNNAAFIGPLIGGITNFIFISLFIASFGAVSGAHFNPLITFATFCARLCSLPRLILYVTAQIGGSVLAGLLIRASYGTRDFKVGGCFLFPDVAPVQDVFVVELVSATILLFLAFGLGLDPRQAQIVGPTLAPFLVGLSCGTLAFASAFSRYGYGGAGLNPARCMGVFVGSRFPTWHWVHWVPDMLACIIHGIIYYFVPPWLKEGE